MKRLACVLLLAAVGAAGCSGGKQAGRPFTVGFMPKLTGIPYFNACKKGAEEAAGELNLRLVYDGPIRAEAEPQINLLEQWAASGEYDCIAVACNDPDQVAGALRGARGNDILVVT